MKRRATSVQSFSTQFFAEISAMCQKTKVSVLEKIFNYFDEHEGLDQVIPWPNGPPSSDCPVVWHADGTPRRHRVRDRSYPSSACPHVRRDVFCPQKTRPMVFRSQKMYFGGEDVGSACPHSRRGLLCPHAPQNTPQVFPQPKSMFLCGNPGSV